MSSGYQDGPLRAVILQRIENSLRAAAELINASRQACPNSEAQHVESSVALFRDSKVILKNESHLHKVPPLSELHFNCTVASDLFLHAPYKNRLQRHRFVHDAVGKDLLLQVDGAAPLVHMLTIHAWTLEEWRDRGGEIEPSPPCLGR